MAPDGGGGPVGLAVAPAAAPFAMSSKSTSPVASSIVMWSRTVWLASVASWRTSALRVPSRTWAITAKTLPCATRSRFANLRWYVSPLASLNSSSQPCCWALGWLGSSTPSCPATERTRRSRSVWPTMRWSPASLMASVGARSTACCPAGISHSPASRTFTSRSRSAADSGPHRVGTDPAARLAGPVPERSAYDHTGNAIAPSVATSAAMIRAVPLTRRKVPPVVLRCRR